MSSLRIVRGPIRYKITLWLDPATYFLLMKKSAALASGKVSMHKWLKKTLEIDDAKERTTPTKVLNGLQSLPVRPAQLQVQARKQQKAA